MAALCCNPRRRSDISATQLQSNDCQGRLRAIAIPKGLLVKPQYGNLFKKSTQERVSPL
ncbi:hypothetical protein AG1IA_03222 [Rhizoctonia solani AG-1 IA]|uniref:Uncharacterized protein n=1 Tax=Thanatephorus cucumeris (strain AG1-IA) TaxID=983506 RepID=L8WXN2_THACA|nr:hypothetical protein AG1IA_03222 [Rhizoctonia solani AG-1 IA]